ncbi:MAG: hypothetical protein KGO96_00060 [Elusimicrobia bacterium]|nr:hypothetical protein [Elusimicrobiota bacterium]MDE2424286.1 hypothetical protein [Elusimicrobiota bacterium]
MRAKAGDFSLPYDPDFSQPQSEEPAAPSPAPTAATPSAAAPSTAPSAAAERPWAPRLPFAGPFLLLDRTDPNHILEQPEAPAPAAKSFADFEQGLKGLKYSQGEYDQVRDQQERGLQPGEEAAGAPASPESVSSAPAPKPPPPEVELPAYGTSLSVTGRKVIGVSFQEKRFLYDQSATGRPQTTNLLTIDQQLQLRMQGKVGPKITVNVDYDDTKANHQDISVVYTGDPNEVVQNVSFGDIDLSLPSTEFVSYNKQLFGIRADIKYKGWSATFIGSRTKGTTKSKRFVGNSQFVSADILDTGYVRRQFYDLTFGEQARLPIKPGSERVFLSQNSAGQVSNANNVTFTADDLAVRSSSFTGIFTQLNPGLDYTIDYAKGIVKFQTPLQPQFALAVDFIDASGQHLTAESSTTTLAGGGTGLFKLLKTPSDVPISTATEVGYDRELKTYYNIGQQQIVRDNGRGNFILRVLDQQRNEVGSSLNPVQKYPDTINVDFENGTFNLLQPFSVSNASPTVPDPDVYAVSPISKRIIHVEYSFRFKTFFLEPNLVPQSEVVLLDGQKLNRNVDYFIDYDAGFVTFFDENRIQSNSEIDISYEVAPFAGSTNESLLGTRVAYNFNKHFSVGSTLLYDAGTKSPTVPTIDEIARSLLVYDFDSQLRDVTLFGKLHILSLGGELAQSRQQPNLNGNALVDNMEGIKQEDAVTTFAQDWFIASQSPAIGAGSTGEPADSAHEKWFSEDVPVLQINPNAEANAQQSQKVLDFQYDSLAGNEEVSMVFPFSISGDDFSQRSVLEVVMLGDASGNDINFRLGGINEDADGTGGTTLFCADNTVRAGVPKTEDVDCDGILQPSEDVGWLYAPTTGPGAGQTERFTPNNGHIDSEDLNANGRLDPDDGNGNNFGYGTDLTGSNPQNGQLFDTTDSKNHSTLDFGNAQWQTFQIPLNISSATVSRWTNIKNIRITIRRRAGGAASGLVKFARIAVVGNSWLNGTAVDPATGNGPVANESMVVTAVNNVDNPSYVPIFSAGGDATSVFNDLYGGLANLQKQSNTQNVSEQSLQLSWSSATIGVGNLEPVLTTKRLFTKAIDLSQHRYFNFLLYGNAPFAQATPCPAVPTAGQPNCSDHTFFLRVGNDTNFFEVRVPINFVGWKHISVRQADTGNNSIANQWVADTAGTVVVSSGAPSLQQVAEIVAGVRRDAAGNSPGVVTTAPNTATSGEVWLDEIYMSQPLVRVGNARKLEGAFEIPGWASFGGKYREVDQNFQTPTSVVSNQDSRIDSGYLNFTRFRFLPLNFTLQRQITDTPNTAQTGDLSNLVTLLQEGKVTTWTGTAQANFTLGALPRVSLGMTRNRIEYDLLTRTDDRRAYTATLQYSVPLHSRLAPKSVDLGYTRSDYDVTFDRADVLQQAGNYNTFERGNTYTGRLSFTPWNGSSFNPTFSLNRVTEHRDDFTHQDSPGDLHLDYQKSFHESAGFSSNFRFSRWLNPQVNYNADILENNILNVSTVVVNNQSYTFGVGEIKTVNRSANGSISLPLAIGDIFPRSKAFRSMNIVSGYQLQDGDVWNNVENGLNTAGALWLRTPLHPNSPAAQLANLTLRDTYDSTQRWSPLEAYGLPGRWAALRTLSVSNNFIRTIQRSETTGTPSKTVSNTLPDLVASVSQLEKLFGASSWMRDTQLNYKFKIVNTKTIGQTSSHETDLGADLRTIIRRRFDTLLSYNSRDTNSVDLLVDANTQKVQHQDATAQVTFDVRKFRFTPKTDYTHDVTTLGTGIKTQDLTVITPSLLVRADLALPRGLRLPGSTKTILFSNRIIWTTTLSLAHRSSPVTQADNSDLASITTSSDYEIAKNLRMTLNGALSREWHRFLKSEEFISYQFGTTLTFQF